MSATRDRVALAAFAMNALLAGGKAVAIRFSNRELARCGERACDSPSPPPCS